MSPSRLHPDAAQPTGHDHSRPARKPMGRAASEVEHSGIVAGSKRGRPESGRKVAEVIESTVLFWGITRDPLKRAKVRAHVRRMRKNKKRRYDPRLAPRLIAKRMHIPEIAVDEILQGTVPEFEEWKEEFMAGIARAFAAADERAAATWLRRSA